jgi:hypothetical protein
MRTVFLILALILISLVFTEAAREFGPIIGTVIVVVLMMPMFAVSKVLKRGGDKADQRARDRALQQILMLS